MHQLVLASQSPRRRQLLEQAGYEFHTLSVEVSEIPQKNLNLPSQIRTLAQRKAQAVVTRHKSLEQQGILLLSADTVVVIDSEILGKPSTIGEARSHLSRLSGRRHQVITGVCLWQTQPEKQVCFHECTVVEFHALSTPQIDAYLATGEPFDKAGGYGIQGAGRELVKDFQGSLSNVIGLPLEKLQQELAKHGWQLRRRELSQST